MKILLISFWFYDYTIQLANSLSKRETVMLILPAHIPSEFLKNLNENVILYLFDQPKKLYNPLNLRALIEIAKQTSKFNPDIIHYQVNNMLICALLPILKRYPFVVTIHDIRPHIGEDRIFSKLFQLAVNYAIKVSQHIFVHGVKLKELLVSEYNITPEKVHAIPLGEHEVALFEPYRRPELKEEGNLILFFGRIWKYKGLDYLMLAEPMITKKLLDAKIIIAGKGENLKRYENLMANKNSFAVYNENISYQKGAELFQKSSVVVLPYIEASQSGVIPVAYSFKKPVVVTDVGSISECVDEDVTGLIVPPKNSIALADAIIKLLCNDDLRKTMGENGYKKLKTELSMDIVAEKTLQVYVKALGAAE